MRVGLHSCVREWSTWAQSGYLSGLRPLRKETHVGGRALFILRAYHPPTWPSQLAQPFVFHTPCYERQQVGSHTGQGTGPSDKHTALQRAHRGQNTVAVPMRALNSTLS